MRQTNVFVWFCEYVCFLLFVLFALCMVDKVQPKWPLVLRRNSDHSPPPISVMVKGIPILIDSTCYFIVLFQSKKQRVIGFIGCLLMGTFCFSLVSVNEWKMVLQLLHFRLNPCTLLMQQLGSHCHWTLKACYLQLSSCAGKFFRLRVLSRNVG